MVQRHDFGDALLDARRPEVDVGRHHEGRRIAQALRALWRAGLVTHPEERRWEVADPFIARILGR